MDQNLIELHERRNRNIYPDICKRSQEMKERSYREFFAVKGKPNHFPSTKDDINKYYHEMEGIISYIGSYPMHPIIACTLYYKDDFKDEFDESEVVDLEYFFKEIGDKDFLLRGTIFKEITNYYNFYFSNSISTDIFTTELQLEDLVTKLKDHPYNSDWDKINIHDEKFLDILKEIVVFDYIQNWVP